MAQRDRTRARVRKTARPVKLDTYLSQAEADAVMSLINEDGDSIAAWIRKKILKGVNVQRPVDEVDVEQPKPPNLLKAQRLNRPF